MYSPSEVSEPTPSQELPSGVRLEEFIIECVLGSGGFGITYLARDKRLGRQVVIKENLPAQFCWRDTMSLTVQPRQSSGEDADNFQYSLESFEKEAATLASLNHPGIVKVLRSFEANGTAYFVMPFVEGTTFDEVIKERHAQSETFSEEELTGLLWGVLEALAYLHERGIYHRDIKPGNLLITSQGDPVLIDFGAARQRLSERSLTVIESPGYTPFEQMQSRGKVGPWSDLYALGGTLYKAITGETPAKAADRILEDALVPLAKRQELGGRLSKALLAGIDRAMSPRAVDRFKSASDWKDTFKAFPPDESIRPSCKEDTLLHAPSWFYMLNDRKNGPSTPVEVGRAISNGSITPHTLIWNPSMTEWAPACEVSIFSPMFPREQEVAGLPSGQADSTSLAPAFPGISRRFYGLILACFAIGTAIISFALGEAAFVGIMGLYAGIIWASFQRLANIGRNPWWSLLVIVPLLSLWIFIICIMLPTGFQSHRKLDSKAKIVFGLLVALIVFIVVSVLSSWS